MNRKTIAALVALSLTLAPIPSVYAQSNDCGVGPSVPFASETLTVSTTALGFTLATYAPSGGPVANQALVFINTNNVRAAFDGSAPTTSAGAILQAGQSILVCALSLSKTRFIRDDASDADVYVVYSGPQN